MRYNLASLIKVVAALALFVTVVQAAPTPQETDQTPAKQTNPTGQEDNPTNQETTTTTETTTPPPPKKPESGGTAWTSEKGVLNDDELRKAEQAK
ncbi:hypothetical protein BDF19DRAFT_444721 [Syncephalis fuscata]|nr:hypothetical protein BDF19DRAFT_444721 [Syncephalis fuscata]